MAIKRCAVVAMMAVAVVAMLAMLAGSAVAQGTSLSCASKLTPCQKYLNSTKPPPECCGPLKDAVTNELPCLCSIFRSPEILSAFNIDANQALNLTVTCGISTSVNLCNNIGEASPSGSPNVPGAPQATPGNNNGANGIGQIGLSGLAGLFLIWWSILA